MIFDDIKGRFEALEGAVLTAESVGAWLKGWSDLEEELEEASGWVYVNAAKDTRDSEAAKAIQAFQGELVPKVQEAEQRLKVKLLDSGLKPEGFRIFLRALQADREIFRPENPALSSRLAEMGNEYNVIAGAQSVKFDGKEQTLRQMAGYLEKPDRKLREKAWRAMTARRIQDRDKLDALFDRILNQRFVIAGNANYADYAKFRYKEYNRFDYTPEDAMALHGRVFKAFGPLIARKNRWKAKAIGLKALKPWDGAYDPTGAEPLAPFKTVEELYEGVRRIYARLSPEPAAMLERLWTKGLLDLESRLGKGPGGFNHALPKSKGSFIFWSASGLQTDVIVLLHEGGHAYQGELGMRLDSFHHQQLPMEFAELGSTSMELLGQAHFEEFYASRDADRARLDTLWDIADSICRIASVDRFQHLIHAQPTMSAAERHACWLELSRPLMEGVDFKGFEDIAASSWQSTLHIFRLPFYYLDYAFAQMGALQIWEKSLGDPAGAFEDYKRGIALGSTKSLPELYAAAGCEFMPSDARLASLASRLEAEIQALLKRLGQAPLSA